MDRRGIIVYVIVITINYVTEIQFYVVDVTATEIAVNCAGKY
jgi:hypothetical protein|tara:strand:- start:602 stop:727 length:126 start_codon:yes stop_codon:yes gene_type:complete